MKTLTFKAWLAINKAWLAEVHSLFLKTGEKIGFEDFSNQIFQEIG